MRRLTSRITKQGQISVPAEVRRQLGIGPGTVLEWEVEGDVARVRRGHDKTFDDAHRALFPEGPPPRASVRDMDRAIADEVRRRHARD
jgi:AbrB family looped-hinge helix DNA binding protein